MFKTILSSMLLAIAVSASAQTIAVPPELKGKVITMIIPYGPGGDANLTHRFMGEHVRKLTGLDIVYINKSGASGIIGATAAASLPPNGTNLFASDGTVHVVSPAIDYQNHVNPDLLPVVSAFAITPQFIYVAGNSPINNARDLAEYAKQNPNLAYGCNSGPSCLFQASLYESTGLKATQVMYGPLTDMAMGVMRGDTVHFMSAAGPTLGLVQAGKLKAVAVGWGDKVKVYPGATPLNTVLPNFKAYNFQMIAVPAGTPLTLIEFWNSVYREVAKLPEVRERMDSVGIVNTEYNVKQSEQAILTARREASKLKHLYVR